MGREGVIRETDGGICEIGRVSYFGGHLGGGTHWKETMIAYYLLEARVERELGGDGWVDEEGQKFCDPNQYFV